MLYCREELKNTAKCHDNMHAPPHLRRPHDGTMYGVREHTNKSRMPPHARQALLAVWPSKRKTASAAVSTPGGRHAMLFLLLSHA